MLRIGSQGSSVSTLQRNLNKLLPDLPPLKIDGIFGPLTEKHVITYQQRNNLKVDGIVGPETANSIVSKLSVIDKVSNAIMQPVSSVSQKVKGIPDPLFFALLAGVGFLGYYIYKEGKN